MGWAGGTELFDRVVDAVRRHWPENELPEEIIEDLVEAFENHDADDLESTAHPDAQAWFAAHPVERREE